MTDMAVIDLQKEFGMIEHNIYYVKYKNAQYTKNSVLGFSDDNIDSNHTFQMDCQSIFRNMLFRCFMYYMWCTTRAYSETSPISLIRE